MGSLKAFEAQPLGDHAAAGDRPNFGAEHPGHGLTSGQLALGSHASSGVAFTGRTPMIDNREVPLISSGQRSRVPLAWLVNAHRASATAS
jgi:hypothetical protein